MIPQLFAIYAGRPHFQPPERNKERSGEPQQGNISPCLYRLSLSWLAFIGSVGGTLGRLGGEIFVLVSFGGTFLERFTRQSAGD